MSRPRLQRTPSGGYLVQPVDPVSGRRLHISGRTEGEVWTRYDAVLKARSELRHGLTSPGEAAAVVARSVVGGPVSIKILWDRHMATLLTRWRPKAEGYWRRHLGPILGERRAWELTQTECERLMVELRARTTPKGRLLSPKTIRNIWDTLSAAIRRGVADRYLPDLPWGAWKPRFERWQPQREAARSSEELQAIVLAAARRDVEAMQRGRFADLAMRIVILTLCGLRQGEGAGLGWDCVSIDVEPAVALIQFQAVPGWRSKNSTWDRPRELPKGAKARRVVLHPSAVAALRAQRERVVRAGWYRPDGPVFPVAGGAWRSGPKLVDPELFRAIVREAGLPNPERWTTHSTRHSFATLELATGADLRSVQARTGHSSIRVLEGYLHSMGRGLPGSAIPALAPALLEAAGALPALEAPAPAGGSRAIWRPEEAADLARQAALLSVTRREGPVIDAVAVSVDEARRVEDARAKERAERRTRTRAAWAKGAARQVDLAVRWLTEGGAGQKYPREIRSAAELAYVRGYSQAKRDGLGVEARRVVGRKERAGVLAQWNRSLGMARAKLARAVGGVGSGTTGGLGNGKLEG